MRKGGGGRDTPKTTHSVKRVGTLHVKTKLYLMAADQSVVAKHVKNMGV